MPSRYLYIVHWLVNSAVLFLSSLMSPQVILGKVRFNNVESALYAGFWMTFVVWVCWDFALARKFKFDRPFVIFSFFFFVNSLAVLAVSRFWFITGFELANYNWALVIGLAATILQRIGIGWGARV